MKKTLGMGTPGKEQGKEGKEGKEKEKEKA